MTAPTVAKTIYANNKDLLREIHNSKKTYCWFEKPEHSDYDLIVSNLDEIIPEAIDKIIFRKANPKGKIVPIICGPEDLVFRLMTYEHIPLDPLRKRKARNTGDESYTRTNFPSFKHYVLRNGELVEVGRSHWKGDLATGVFCVDHGRMSNALAKMFMMLVERYSRRGNWRGYCFSSDTECLTKRGWLKYNDIQEDDLVLSTKDGSLEWTNILEICKFEYTGDMFHLTVGDYFDTLVTPNHRFLTTTGAKEVDYLLETDRIVCMADALNDVKDKKYTDEFVELVGWTVTEGCFYSGAQGARLTIYQNEGDYADRIRRCLNASEFTFSETHRQNENAVSVAFTINKRGRNALSEVIDSPGKVMRMKFMLDLTKDQREILIQTMIDGDGNRRYGKFMTYNQKNIAHVDMFRILCSMSGYRTSAKKQAIVTKVNQLDSHIYKINIFSPKSPKGRLSRVENIDFHGGKRNGSIKGRGKHTHRNEPTVPYNGEVWCLRTGNGSLLVKRNDTIYLSSNSYVDEMRSLALVQLSQIGLQFDESKGDNPFAFFTTAVKNCLAGETLILTKEYGSVPIEQVSEQDVSLLDGNGDWVKCHIYDHGEQETQMTYFLNGGRKIGIRSTANHGWMTPDGIVHTGHFSEAHNTKVNDLRPSKTINDQLAYDMGIMHGLVYGDGSLYGKDKYQIRLSGEKNDLRNRFDIAGVNINAAFWPSHNGDEVITIKEPWCDLKAFPVNPGDDLDYLLGFFRGWFATDGCVSKVPTPTLCGDESEYNWVKQWGPLIGWHVGNFVELAAETNYGLRKKKSVNMHLARSSMDVEDFLRSKHSERWSVCPKNKRGKDIGNKYNWPEIEKLRDDGMMWKDIAVKLGVNKSSLASAYCLRNKAKASREDVYWTVTGRIQPKPDGVVERVYCPVVETTGTFALSFGIHSSNCFTRFLNLERRNQNIRDDLMIFSGALPSYTRQIEHELERKFPPDPAPAKKRPGRKPAAVKKAEAATAAAASSDDHNH